VQSVNGHALPSTTTPPTQVPSARQQMIADAVSALFVLGIPKKQALALIQSVPGNTKEELIRGALQVLRQGRTP
jgi:hypothetical protein